MRLGKRFLTFLYLINGNFSVVNTEKRMLWFDIICDEQFFMNFGLGFGYNVIFDECSFELTMLINVILEFYLIILRVRLNISFLRTML
ncbi:hypothetical protein BmIO_00574 [Borrelia miyamotoi]|nr:hypothetical protein BmIO_00574 [Borrelia miyamotoi]